jgi:hypothetical protein
MEFANDPFEDEDSKTVDATAPGADTAAINAAAASVTSGTVHQAPTLAGPEDGYVRLPGGLVIDGELVQSAEVRELTGEDEEYIARARGHVTRYLSAILDRGVVRIGDTPANPTLLKELLLGDRDALLLGIRVVTFGRTIPVEKYSCTGCQQSMDIEVDVTTIPVRDGDEAGKAYEVPLRKGGVAMVRLPVGADQRAVFENQDLNPAEANTILLARVVDSLDGKKVKRSTDTVKRLGVADRKRILDFISEKQPGPLYDEITFVHEECETENHVFLGVVDLFRDL